MARAQRSVWCVEGCEGWVQRCGSRWAYVPAAIGGLGVEVEAKEVVGEGDGERMAEEEKSVKTVCGIGEVGVCEKRMLAGFISPWTQDLSCSQIKADKRLDAMCGNTCASFSARSGSERALRCKVM